MLSKLFVKKLKIRKQNHKRKREVPTGIADIHAKDRDA